jgi:hypothetical protein
MANAVPASVQQLVQMRGLKTRELRRVRNEHRGVIARSSFEFMEAFGTTKRRIKSQTVDETEHAKLLCAEAEKYLNTVNPQVESLQTVQKEIDRRGIKWGRIWGLAGAVIASLSAWAAGIGPGVIFGVSLVAVGVLNFVVGKSTEKFLNKNSAYVAMSHASEIAKRKAEDIGRVQVYLGGVGNGP